MRRRHGILQSSKERGKVMAKFKVTVAWETGFETIIEANSQEEAEQIALHEGGHYDGDWTTDDYVKDCVLLEGQISFFDNIPIAPVVRIEVECPK